MPFANFDVQLSGLNKLKECLSTTYKINLKKGLGSTHFFLFSFNTVCIRNAGGVAALELPILDFILVMYIILLSSMLVRPLRDC